MNRDSFELKNFSHSVGQNWYHVVLVPKKRYPLFAQKNQRDLMIEGLLLVCKKHKFDLYEYEIMPDHVHIFVSCPPDCSIRKMIQLIKGSTSFYIRSNHLSLRKYKGLWSKGCMYRSVGNVSAEKIKNYIQNSNKWVIGQRTLI